MEEADETQCAAPEELEAQAAAIEAAEDALQEAVDATGRVDLVTASLTARCIGSKAPVMMHGFCVILLQT